MTLTVRSARNGNWGCEGAASILDTAEKRVIYYR